MESFFKGFHDAMCWIEAPQTAYLSGFLTGMFLIGVICAVIWIVGYAIIQFIKLLVD